MRIATSLVALAALLAFPAAAQTTDRERAIALHDEGKGRDAIPIFEQLIAAGGADKEVYRRLGLLLLSTAATAPDSAERRLQRARARSLLAKAVELGESGPQTTGILAALPADGGRDQFFSADPRVQRAMMRGEAAFGAGNLRAAQQEYLDALQLDTAQYLAAVFLGDVMLRLTKIDSAYHWYAHATKLDADRETGWRYWSDVLLRQGRSNDARDKAIEAVIAEPYTRIAHAGLASYANVTRTPIRMPAVDFPPRDSTAAKTPAKIAYDSVRAAWKGTDGTPSALFAAKYPGATYRHSLAEETDALRAAYRTSPDDASSKLLKRMDDAGVLEAFVLNARASQGIIWDYAAYRRDNRATLRKFWLEYVIGARYAR